MGFGQGALLMTPLQMALIGATIADGGNEPRPYLVRQIVRDGAVASVYAVRNPRDARFRRETAANVKKMMVAVVQRGTGTPARIPGVDGRGKNRNGDQSARAVALVVRGFAPADNPRVAVAIVVENGGYGATSPRRSRATSCETALGSAK